MSNGAYMHSPPMRRNGEPEAGSTPRYAYWPSSTPRLLQRRIDEWEIIV